VIPIEQVTGSPNDGWSREDPAPQVHGGLLARRAHPGDRAALAEHGITPIDLVVVNLYPFRETVAKPGVTFEQAIEQIDIGGLRCSARPRRITRTCSLWWTRTTIPGRRRAEGGGPDPGASPGLRRELATKVFAHTAAYDAAIHGYLTKDAPGWPERITLALERRQELRYGENPHQAGALYATAEPGIRDLEQLSGKELSFTICWTWTRGSWRSRPGARAVQTAPRAPSSNTPRRVASRWAAQRARHTSAPSPRIARPRSDR